jgi:hypothetical protein
MNKWMRRILLFLAWPVIAPLLILCVAVLAVVAWPMCLTSYVDTPPPTGGPVDEQKPQ